MTQFSFTTNIEKRMPKTGEVFCIDRMTSDYAQAHPFDVDAFIEGVYQKFAGTEFEEPREALRGVWTAVLSDMNPCGDVSLYPNRNDARRAAALEVWHKAGDYWRRGMRLGDILPDMVPMTKITRLDDGSWIALFQKDMHLLDNSVPSDSAARPSATPVQEPTAEPAVTEPVRNQSEPQQLDLFAFQLLQEENERLRQQIAQMADVRCMMDDEPLTINQPRPCRQCQPRKPAAVRPPHSACPAIPLQEDNRDRQNLLKALGMVAAATVALFVIYETGLLIPLGLIGLASGGILK